ncbi:hypothetical protein [Absidia glauca]|uniref:CCHC-type domain-containing protein n=1 Tax=Absidia glauca TaxID=4829 RepID=A0A163M2F4_ABSGL|nr:hypothetical protein [Absidia glauca]
MALSDNEQLLSGAEFKSTPSGSRAGTKPRSFAQVVANKRESLMTSHNGRLDNVTLDDGITIRHSHIWRTSRSEGAYLFDLAGLPGTEQQHIETIIKQYPHQYGIIIKRDSPGARYAEVYVDLADHPDILTKGVFYDDLKLRILPNTALPDNQNIVRLSLRNLPFYKPPVLLEGLQQSLGAYGVVLNVGILRDPKTKAYSGTGYAVLALPKAGESSAVSLPPLTHNIPWNKGREGFYATWSNMPTWCRYCHEEGHTKFDCAKSLANLLCYNCHNLGHRSSDCPRRNPGTTPIDDPVTSSNWADESCDEDYTPSHDGSDDSEDSDSNTVDSHIMDFDDDANDEQPEEFSGGQPGERLMNGASEIHGVPGTDDKGSLASKYAHSNPDDQPPRSSKISKAGTRSRPSSSQ